MAGARRQPQKRERSHARHWTILRRCEIGSVNERPGRGSFTVASPYQHGATHQATGSDWRRNGEARARGCNLNQRPRGAIPPLIKLPRSPSQRGPNHPDEPPGTTRGGVHGSVARAAFTSTDRMGCGL
eukprot:3689485-Prymnesium_polylepis.1